MLRDVFYYGNKPNVHPREQFAESLEDARQKATTRDFWIINEFCDYKNFDWDFDFEFLPDEDVWAEDHNNVWPSQHQKDSGTWLCPKQHSDIIIYRGDVDPVIRKNIKNDNWVEFDLIDHTKFDFSWHPDPTEPPYIYRWGCKYFPVQFKHVLEYNVPGATQIKYMRTTVELLPEYERWVEKQPIDSYKFDFSWRPDPLDPPFIYIWGNKYFDGKSSPTLEYHTPGATDKKYMPELVSLKSDIESFEFFEKIDKNSFDFSWRPDPTSPPYIYAWGNQWNNVEDKISIQYAVEGATEYKFMSEKTKRLPTRDNWIIPDDVDVTDFDFSWEPNPASPPYIYEFATQWQKTGGPMYVVEGATEKKYIDVQQAKRIPSNKNWTIPDNIDISGFDFSWHPDNTSPPYVYVFATQWAFSGGPVYTVDGATEIKYVDDQIATAKVDMTNWVYDEKLIGINTFDFSWHPYVEDQPYIYQFGTQWQKTGGPKYITPGADSSSPIKYIDTRILKAIRLANLDAPWNVCRDYTIDKFDFSWHPDDTEEPYIYVFGTTLYPVEDMSVIEYRVPGATQKKYVHNLTATLAPDQSKWDIPYNLDVTDFDFSWVPNPNDPPYIYEFGTQHQKTGGPRYVVAGATEVKYIDAQRAIALPHDNWKYYDILYTDKTSFDFSWHPDATDPPYIYAWGNQWVKAEDRPFIEYHSESATEYQYMGDTVKRLHCRDNWQIPDDVDTSNFDFSWEPSPKEEPYIYQFGTQHQKTGGPRYVVNGAAEVKYVDIQHTPKMPNKDLFTVLNGYKIKDFDYSWHPDDTEEPYIYVFGNNYYPVEEAHTIEYRMDGATQIKYVYEVVATLDVDMSKWTVPSGIDTTDFDFAWVPNPNDPPLIYEFGTQHQKTGGPKYNVDGAEEIKYLDLQKVKHLPCKGSFTITEEIDEESFDFSWHPDNTDPPYIYAWGNQWNKPEDKISVKYVVDNATEIKFMEERAIRKPSTDNWDIPENVDVATCDFSWEPSPAEEPFIYQFGTQWQKTGGPRYIANGSSEHSPVKYIDVFTAVKLPTETDANWNQIHKIKDFDYSWHPDSTEEPYIYVFGNNLYPAEECASVEYRVPGATQTKFIQSIVATLDQNLENWDIPENVDVTDFDFSWVPNPNDPPYIYEFATQWQKTGGPRYAVDGAAEFKYLDFQKAKKLPNRDNWLIPENVDVADFDFSWHPDNTDPAYIYQFGTQWALSGGPKYVVEGATEIKYMDDLTAKALPDRTNWVYDENEIDVDSFDFSWHPYVEDQPYIYQFGTQWQKTGGPKYITPGADSSSPTKYIDPRILKATRIPNKNDTHWNMLYPIEKFDFSWHPDDTEEPYIYIFGNYWYSAEVMPTVEYVMHGATSVKYVHDVVAVLAVDATNWVIPDNLNLSEFDFSWRPEPGSPPFIHQFGTQWQKTGGPKYVVEGATSIKYNDIQKAKRLPSKLYWTIPSNVDVANFDFSWHPDDTDPAYVYQFGTQWALSGGPRYVVPGATELKYIDAPTAKALPDRTNWVYDETEIDVGTFDFSWHPYVEDQPYVYQFGTQWQKTGGPRYITPGSDSTSPVKYIDTRIIKATRLPNKNKFDIVSGFKIKDFDYSWHPDDTSPPYIYVFGNNLYPAEECATVQYKVSGATETKFITDIVARLDKNMNNWEIPENVDVKTFDFSWIPHPAAPPYIYQFGTLQDPTYGPRYITPNTDGEIVKLPRIEVEEDEAVESEETEIVVSQYYIETTLDDLVKQHESELFWALNPDIDYGKFDFSWRPNIEQAQYVHAFGSRDNINTQTYFVNGPQWTKGYRDINYVEDVKIDIKVNIDMFFVDRGNSESAARFEALKAKYGTKIQKTRYLNSWVDTIKRCTNRATTSLIWVLNSELDYNNFDFDYYPNPWQMKMVHVFGTQHSHWGTTFMVNRETFVEDTKYINIIEHLSNLNFVKERRATATECVHDIVLIDHGNRETDKVVETLTSKAGSRNMTTVKYNGSYLDTIKDIVKRQQDKKEHYLWICSSVCDYSTFDFSYVVDPFAKEQLHVFPSGMQKFGDTFFIDVNKAKEIINEIDKLEEFDKVNYNGSLRTKRLPEPVIVTNDDTHVRAALNITGFPYATLITNDNSDITVVEPEPMNLWSSETKNIQVVSTGATRIVVPAEVKDHVTKELYEYPYIKRAPKLAMSNPIDIVFLSNGETGAEENYEHLLNVTKGLKNRVVRVDGINGRVAAYHAAAEASNTPWMFTVFAKLKVSPKFDWNWQPDRMQSPKHYIFHAKNPVNGLVYGHQAMIAYNKKLTLANEGKGLDFTLDNEHEVVPLISGTANYNTDPFSTWRTAFREVIKLKADPSDVAKDRLDAWLNKAQGDFGQFSIKGALDADEYYEEVGGDFDQLKLSYEWDWLRKKFDEI